MSRRLPLALAGLLFVLPACTSDGSEQRQTQPGQTPTCPVAQDVGEVPAECVEGDADFETRPTPTGSAPASSADIAAVTLPEDPGDLAATGNDRDPTRTTGMLTVTVPAGSRLVTTVACEGFADIALTIKPESAAEQTIACGFEGAPAELTVEDGSAVSEDTKFTLTIEAPAPSRWYVVAAATSQPAPDSPV